MRLPILLLALPYCATAITFDLLGGAITDLAQEVADLVQDEGSQHECSDRGGEGCAEDRFCDSDRKCRLKRAGGEACNADFKCLSERCRRDVCEFIEEPVNEPDNALLSDGQECSSNSQCQSGFCDQFVFEGSGNAVSPLNSNTNNPALCQPKKENGDGCNENFECTSNLCKDFECANPDQKLANGEECNSNNQCQSGFCDRFVFEGSGNALTPLSSNTNNPDLCQPKKENGDGCNENVECISNLCEDFECSSGSKPSCSKDNECGNNQFCNPSTKDCEAKLGVDDECNSNNQCKSGLFCNQFVFENSNTNNPSLCEEKRKDGEGCNENNECRSNICNDFECTSSTSSEPSCSKDGECGNGQFCNQFVFANSNTNNPSLCEDKRSNGEGCNSNNWCQSNNCDDFECGAAGSQLPVDSCSKDNDCGNNQFCNKSVFENSNTNNPSLCEDKRSNGKGCNGNNECRSNNCDDFECAATGSQQPVASCSKDKDCNNGEFCNKFVFEGSNTNNPSLCEERRPNGEGCNGNNECQSNNCDEFECAAAGNDPVPGNDLLPVGEKCKDASECESGLYCDKKCKLFVELGSDCKKDRECASGSCHDSKVCVPIEGQVGDFCVENSHCASNRCEGKKDSKTCDAIQVSRSGGDSSKEPPAKKTSAPKKTKTKKRTAGPSNPKKRKSNIRGTRHGDPSWYGW